MGITNELWQALQRKNQDISHAMKLVLISNNKMQAFKDNEWESLFDEVCSFCKIHEIYIPSMDNMFAMKKGGHNIRIQKLQTYTIARLRVILYDYTHATWRANRFSTINIELLLCRSCLNLYDW